MVMKSLGEVLAAAKKKKQVKLQEQEEKRKVSVLLSKRASDNKSGVQQLARSKDKKGESQYPTVFPKSKIQLQMDKKQAATQNKSIIKMKQLKSLNSAESSEIGQT